MNPLNGYGYFTFWSVFHLPWKGSGPQRLITAAGLRMRLSDKEKFSHPLPWKMGIKAWGHEMAQMLGDEQGAERLRVLLAFGDLGEHLWTAPPFDMRSTRVVDGQVVPNPGRMALAHLLAVGPRIEGARVKGPKAKVQLFQRWGALMAEGMRKTPGPLPGTMHDWAPVFKAWLLQPTPDWASIDTVLAAHPDWVMATAPTARGVPALAKWPEGASAYLDDEMLFSAFLARGGDPDAPVAQLSPVPDYSVYGVKHAAPRSALGIHLPSPLPVWWAAAQGGNAAAAQWGIEHDPVLAADRLNHAYLQHFQLHEFPTGRGFRGPDDQVGCGYGDSKEDIHAYLTTGVTESRLLDLLWSREDWATLHADRVGSLHAPGRPQPAWLAVHEQPGLLTRSIGDAIQAEASVRFQTQLTASPTLQAATNACGANLWMAVVGSLQSDWARKSALDFLKTLGVAPKADPAGYGMLAHFWFGPEALRDEASLGLSEAQRDAFMGALATHPLAIVGTTPVTQQAVVDTLWGISARAMSTVRMLFSQTDPATPGFGPALRGVVATVQAATHQDPAPWLAAGIALPPHLDTTAVGQAAAKGAHAIDWISLRDRLKETEQQRAHILEQARSSAGPSARARG
jgi:hypothetical protein